MDTSLIILTRAFKEVDSCPYGSKCYRCPAGIKQLLKELADSIQASPVDIYVVGGYRIEGFPKKVEGTNIEFRAIKGEEVNNIKEKLAGKIHPPAICYRTVDSSIDLSDAILYDMMNEEVIEEQKKIREILKERGLLAEMSKN